MKIAVFSAKRYDRDYLDAANAGQQHQLQYFEVALNPESAPLASGHEAVCVFVNDQLDRPCLEALVAQGVKLVALRCAGFNNVDLGAARELAPDAWVRQCGSVRSLFDQLGDRKGLLLDILSRTFRRRRHSEELTLRELPPMSPTRR